MIKNILLALFFLISLVILDGCATLTDQYTVGVKNCKDLCLKDVKGCKVQIEEKSFEGCPHRPLD